MSQRPSHQGTLAAGHRPRAAVLAPPPGQGTSVRVDGAFIIDERAEGSQTGTQQQNGSRTTPAMTYCMHGILCIKILIELTLFGFTVSIFTTDWVDFKETCPVPLDAWALVLSTLMALNSLLQIWLYYVLLAPLTPTNERNRHPVLRCSLRLVDIIAFLWWFCGAIAWLFRANGSECGVRPVEISMILFWYRLGVTVLPCFYALCFLLFLCCAAYCCPTVVARLLETQANGGGNGQWVGFGPPRPAGTSPEVMEKLVKMPFGEYKKKRLEETAAGKGVKEKETEKDKQRQQQNIMGASTADAASETIVVGSEEAAVGGAGGEMGIAAGGGGGGLAEDEEMQCVVCIMGFEDDEVVLELPCPGRHFFHAPCIEDWLKQSQQCPVCRCMIPEALGMTAQVPQPQVWSLVNVGGQSEADRAVRGARSLRSSSVGSLRGGPGGRRREGSVTRRDREMDETMDAVRSTVARLRALQQQLEEQERREGGRGSGAGLDRSQSSNLIRPHRGSGGRLGGLSRSGSRLGSAAAAANGGGGGTGGSVEGRDISERTAMLIAQLEAGGGSGAVQPSVQGRPLDSMAPESGISAGGAGNGNGTERLQLSNANVSGASADSAHAMSLPGEVVRQTEGEQMATPHTFSIESASHSNSWGEGSEEMRTVIRHPPVEKKDKEKEASEKESQSSHMVRRSPPSRGDVSVRQDTPDPRASVEDWTADYV
uniref:RING-type domain-containing protein n=1 Tax=Chromera velia CCMP2878 TaxID=1169474 RepID=A0A0G4FD91_9ALVE|eukprot:Cvel_16434.t1-p1 / transcript=Cvel_16434.t1 / gene=Cvel_16434 / organism=Chromera_velia_CCMP2878 / gene_product=E3 ubiquitin-protein ligase RNF181, putative / transcript_product=E3 ubiquitin-protein ligase RNF181, putative / location=Cvel_scaffold1266:46014-49097(-) / protein_length=710 / sequence_SO=supercontig / SO=protein_coding / is_pseudo=false